MFNFQIEEMIAVLRADDLIRTEDVGRAEVVLRAYWDDKIALVWTTEDVTYLVPNVTKDQAIELLQILRSVDSIRDSADTALHAAAGQRFGVGVYGEDEAE